MPWSRDDLERLDAIPEILLARLGAALTSSVYPTAARVELGLAFYEDQSAAAGTYREFADAMHAAIAARLAKLPQAAASNG